MWTQWTHFVQSKTTYDYNHYTCKDFSEIIQQIHGINLQTSAILRSTLIH